MHQDSYRVNTEDVTGAALLNLSRLQCLPGYFFWHTCPFLEPNLVTQTLNLSKSFILFINVAQLPIHQY